MATLLGATCCVGLATILRLIAMCCDTLGVVGSNLEIVKFFTQHLWMLHDVVVVWPDSCDNAALGHAHLSSIFNSQHFATPRNMVAKRAQQCCDMLRSFGRGLRILGRLFLLVILTNIEDNHSY